MSFLYLSHKVAAKTLQCLAIIAMDYYHCFVGGSYFYFSNILTILKRAKTSHMAIRGKNLIKGMKI